MATGVVSDIIETDIVRASAILWKGRKFKVDKRYVKIYNDAIVQSDSLSLPLEEWDVCELKEVEK